MKRVIVLLLGVLMVLLLVACGGGEPADPFAEFLPLDTPDFTHATARGLGFVVAADNWSVRYQHGGTTVSIVIGEVADGNGIMINQAGSIDMFEEVLGENLLERVGSIFYDMVPEMFAAENLERQALVHGELGHAIYRISFTTGSAAYPGILFLLTDGEQIAFVTGIFRAVTDEILDDFYDFIASVRFGFCFVGGDNAR